MQLKAHPQELRFVENPDKNGAQRFTSFLQNHKTHKDPFLEVTPNSKFSVKKGLLDLCQKMCRVKSYKNFSGKNPPALCSQLQTHGT